MARLFGLAFVRRMLRHTYNPERRRRPGNSKPRRIVACEQRVLLSGVSAADDAVSVPHGYAVGINVGSNDTLSGSMKQFEIVQQGTKGTAAFSDPSTGAFTYSTFRQYGFVGDETVIYKVKCYDYDSNWNLVLIGEDTASVVITGTNAAPNAADDYGYSAQMGYSDIEGVNEYDAIKVTFTAEELLLNDSDNDPLEKLSIVGGSNATLLHGDPSDPFKVTGIEFLIEAGSTGPQTLTYTVADYYGATDTASIFVNVAAVKDPWQISKGDASSNGAAQMFIRGKGVVGEKAKIKVFRCTGVTQSGQNDYRNGVFIEEVEVEVDLFGTWTYIWTVPAVTNPKEAYFFQLQNGLNASGMNGKDNRFRKETKVIVVE